MAFEPVRVSTQGPSIEDERMPVFYIDDREFTAPKRLAGGTLLEAVVRMSQQGREAASLWLAQQALGADAVTALFECKHIEIGDATKIMNSLAEVYFGQASGALGIKGDDEGKGSASDSGN